MIRNTEDTIFEYDPDNNNDIDLVNNENSAINDNNSILKSFRRSIQNNEQMINGSLIKTDCLKLIQTLSLNENIKISRLRGSSINTEDINGSLIRIKSDISEIEDNIKTYENINKNGSENTYLNMTFLNDSKSLLNEIDEIKVNLNNLIEKQKLLETSMNSIEHLKQQNISSNDVLEELSNYINIINESNIEESNIEKSINNDKDKEIEVSIECIKSSDNSIELKNLLDLERKIYELESKLGIDKLSTMPYTDIQTAIHNMSQKLSLLDTNRLEGIFRRVQALSSSIEQLNKKRNELNNSLFNETDSENITKLYDIIQKWRNTGAALPFVLERLKLLKFFHQDISTINSRIAVMESQQIEIEKILDTCKLSFNKLNMSIEQIYKKLQEK